MFVDPEIEGPTRELMGQIIRQEWDELENELRTLGSEKLLRVLVLCVFAAGYIAIDAVGRWPTDADLRFQPRDKRWWEYLDVIEYALETAAQTDRSLLPALMLFSQRDKVAKKQ
jgi:hypothetical protein